MPDFKTWANLKPETPFSQLFPDGRVPIRSILPIIPREEGAPRCYLVPGSQLTDEQIRGLAELIWRQWQPECETLEQAIAYIREDALPLRTDWFVGISSVDQGMMLGLAEFGEELADSDDDWEDWDDDDGCVCEDEFGDSFHQRLAEERNQALTQHTEADMTLHELKQERRTQDG